MAGPFATGWPVSDDWLARSRLAGPRHAPDTESFTTLAKKCADRAPPVPIRAAVAARSPNSAFRATSARSRGPMDALVGAPSFSSIWRRRIVLLFGGADLFGNKQHQGISRHILKRPSGPTRLHPSLRALLGPLGQGQALGPGPRAHGARGPYCPPWLLLSCFRKMHDWNSKLACTVWSHDFSHTIQQWL